MIEHCEVKYYYYPLRALTEFYIEGESEKALSKKLNAENLLIYKQNKTVFGRDLILIDY